MIMTENPKPTPKPRGRQSKPIPKLAASPEKIARAVFSAVKKPDPSRRVGKGKQAAKGNSDFERNI